MSPGRREMEVANEQLDQTVVQPASRPGVQFAPQTSCHPYSRPTSAWPVTLPPPRRDVAGRTGYENVSTAARYDDDDDVARRALLAIYEAGKPDMTFQTRAPSTAALEKMLVAISDSKVRDSTTAASAIRTFHSSRRHPQHRVGETGHRYATGRDVSDDDRPVKVKVECPPRSDTVFSFRVQSNAA